MGVLKVTVRDYLENFSKKSFVVVVSCFVNLSVFCAEKDKSFSLVDSVESLTKSSTIFWENLSSFARTTTQKIQQVSESKDENENVDENFKFEAEKIINECNVEIHQKLTKCCILLRYMCTLVMVRSELFIQKFSEIFFNISW